jgi:hypothetical protein
MTTRSSIYADQGRRGVANLTAERPHQHDLGITISVGDLTPDQLAGMRVILEAEVQALVERVNTKTAYLTDQNVTWHVTFDGSRECGEH